MSKLQERLDALEIRVVTPRSEAAILKATARAAEAGRSSMTNSIVEVGRGREHVDLAVRGPGGIVRQMVLRVRWRLRDNGDREVQVEVGDHLTTRPTFMFIPVGPKSAPAMRSAERFVASLRKDLAATRV
jgi:hypothetical protein